MPHETQHIALPTATLNSIPSENSVADTDTTLTTEDAPTISEEALTSLIPSHVPITLVDSANQSEQLDIEMITARILFYKGQIVHSFIEIGRLLIEAKDQLKQVGNELWLNWLHTRVDISERNAQRYMKLAREYPNPTALSDLGLTKALALLTLPANERDDFISRPHIVNGTEKDVSNMSTREFEEAIRECKGSQKKSPIMKSDKKFSFTPRNKKDRKKRPDAIQEMGVSSEPEYDVKASIEYLQACAGDLIDFLLEDRSGTYYEEYNPDLATLCEHILPYLLPNYCIHTCIERVIEYLDECYYDDEDDCIDELCKLRDMLIEALSSTESEAS